MNPTINRDELVKRLDLSGVPTNLQDEILAQLGENILTSVTLEVITKLSEEDRLTFEKLLQQDDSKGIERFLSEKVPEIDSLIKEKTDKEIDEARKTMNQ